MLQKHAIKKLLLVDDDEILQGFLCRYLNSAQYAVEGLLDGSHLPVALDSTRVDLIVLDVELPGRDGFYWLKWLQQYHPHIPIIVASVRSNEHERLTGLEFGARDYLVKPFQYKELLIRIENILGTALPKQDDTLIRIGELEVDTRACTVIRGCKEVKLTLLEASILKLLYINGGVPVSRDDIMAQVRGTSYNPLDRSIDIHINKLRKKVENDPSTPTYIRTIRGKGYCLHIPGLTA
jgi:Response regulators consisting of a CheY-like receiver domain and a winged-helix DNA-binding domain